MNILIIGYGKMGQIRHNILYKSKDIKKIFIFDRDKLKFSTSNSKTQFIRKINKAIINELDAVFVCTFVNVAPKYVIKFLSLNIPVYLFFL